MYSAESESYVCNFKNFLGVGRISRRNAAVEREYNHNTNAANTFTKEAEGDGYRL